MIQSSTVVKALFFEIFRFFKIKKQLKITLQFNRHSSQFTKRKDDSQDIEYYFSFRSSFDH